MKKYFLIGPQAFKFPLAAALTIFLILPGCTQKQSVPEPAAQSQDDYTLIAQAFLSKQNGVAVQAHGIVGQLLNDDSEPPRHQRFIVRLPSGQTLLVVHNIDIAPRIDDLKSSVPIYFRGEYIFSEKGGTIHKTHHDPLKRMPGGWIEFNGKKYE